MYLYTIFFKKLLENLQYLGIGMQTTAYFILDKNAFEQY